MPGGEGAVPEDRCRQVVRAERGGRARARGLERLVRPIEGDRAIGSAGVAEEGEGKLEGGPRNDRYEDGITRGPLASTHGSLSVSVRLLLLLLAVGSGALLHTLEGEID